MCYDGGMVSRTPPKLPTLPRALYAHVVKGRIDALAALLANPAVDYTTPLNSGVYNVFHAVGLCQDLSAQRQMLAMLEEKWPPGHPAWSSRKNWGESVMSDVYHFQWYEERGCPVNEVTSEGRSLLSQVVLGNYSRTTPETRANGMALFDHLRKELTSCQGLLQVELAWQSAVLGVHVEMMEKILSLGLVKVNALMVGPAPSTAALPLPRKGMDPAYAVLNHYRSYGSPTSRPRFDRAFDAMHRHGLDWGVNPDPDRYDSRHEMMVSLLGTETADPWYQALRARSREHALNAGLPVAVVFTPSLRF